MMMPRNTSTLHMLLAILLLLCLPFAIISEEVERQVFVGHSMIPDTYRECLDDGQGKYQCSIDPVESRKEYDLGRSPHFAGVYHMGVAQKIDGNDSEQEAIKDVMQK